MPPSLALDRLTDLLATMTPRVVACSGGVDSMLLATIAHRGHPQATIVAHAVSEAVPAEATERAAAWAAREGWRFEPVSAGETRSEDYVANPVDRCYHCKRHLYARLDAIAAAMPVRATLLSGANTDDLGEYRPGLTAAAERNVRHPFVECGIDKATIRAIAASLELPFAQLPASPCLASRLYTGTRVTPRRLAAVDAGERLLRSRAGIDVVRCRLAQDAMLIEVADEHRSRITPSLVAAVADAVRAHEPAIRSVELDPRPYRAGRAFVRPA